MYHFKVQFCIRFILPPGYYRVNYDDELWTSITEALLTENFGGIPDVNRAQIIDDVFSLAKVDKVSYSKVFEIVQFLKGDSSYITWYPAFTGFNYLFRRLGFESVIGEAIGVSCFPKLSDLGYNLKNITFRELLTKITSNFDFRFSKLKMKLNS